MGERFNFCQRCGKEIKFERTAAGKWMPTDMDGKPHWITCPKASEFRAKKDKGSRSQAEHRAKQRLPEQMRLV